MTLTTKIGTGALITSAVASLGALGGHHFRKEEKINTAQQKTKNKNNWSNNRKIWIHTIRHYFN